VDQNKLECLAIKSFLGILQHLRKELEAILIKQGRVKHFSLFLLAVSDGKPPGSVVDHDEVGVVAVEGHVVTVLHLHVGVVPVDEATLCQRRS
jgi:hypothetical protein